ncbi:MULTISPECIES: hypothetical protein [Aneurinibacillus]|uniref:Uncharacterized protein n=1 Tax=Aneurinibacillus thermoaerophilus TaxID=143495 RepID=A0A1G8AWN2_ANETH|nr:MULTISPECIES: hypothetical protein [Aneurinibacillus]MED0675183.1 hypothetical protein [Aneurinibacillus thermoaerophilus]MED0680122.1 hypothetical protein [Aneurinibacillus thermoaerophilus]MED0735691.1 hypothetical protein [Aneurinibacillus thermoaerophilus]MED0759082.1 hypothetical protein [Aneurinibacillus thermoaerophilus]MED0762666.1 hypothetical protein [Aneurinibacillus thermoaerophilus]
MSEVFFEEAPEVNSINRLPAGSPMGNTKKVPLTRTQERYKPICF